MLKKGNKNIIIFISSILLLFLFLYLASFSYAYDDNVTQEQPLYKTLTIEEKKDNYTILASYPRFDSLKIDKIITDYLYTYVNSFKEESKISSKLNTLNIEYNLYSKDKYVNIFFNIESSLSDDKYKNILIDTISNKEVHIEEIYGMEDLQSKIKTQIENKYSNNVLSSIDFNNLNKYTYYFDDDEIRVYFDIINDSTSYIPEVVISENTPVFNEYDKIVVFTFDDGPSENTLDIVNVLSYYDYSATFFMLGNRMKYNKEIVKKVSESNNEIGSHSYSHKNFGFLTKKEMLNEFNSTQIIYNEITSKNIEYFRPPYGSYNTLVRNTITVPLILWSIDPKDWLTKDSDDISNHILSRVYDGSIVLLHDVYPTTVEALKKVLPQLKEMGYKVVSISEALEIKDVSYPAGSVVREIK